MIESLLAWLAGITTGLITHLGYGGLFLASAVESACIPLPSEIIFPFAGYLVYQTAAGAPGNAGFTFAGVMIWGVAGQVAGSLLAYWAGASGALPLLRKYGKFIFIKAHHLDTAHGWFLRHGEATVFWSRVLPVIRTFISLPAGVAQMPLGRFLAFTTIGCIPWLAALTYAGMKLGEHWIAIQSAFHAYHLQWIILAFVLAALGWWWLKSAGRQRPREPGEDLPT